MENRLKLDKLTLAILEVAEFQTGANRFPGIRLCRSTGDDLEADFSKFMRRNVAPSEGEGKEAYCRPQNREVADSKRDVNVNATMQRCLRLTTWYKNTTGYNFLAVQDHL